MSHCLCNGCGNCDIVGAVIIKGVEDNTVEDNEDFRSDICESGNAGKKIVLE